MRQLAGTKKLGSASMRSSRSSILSNKSGKESSRRESRSREKRNADIVRRLGKRGLKKKSTGRKKLRETGKSGKRG